MTFLESLLRDRQKFIDGTGQAPNVLRLSLDIVRREFPKHEVEELTGWACSFAGMDILVDPRPDAEAVVLLRQERSA